MNVRAAVLCLAVSLVCIASTFCAADWRADMDPTGMMWGLRHDGDLLAVRTQFVVAAPRWQPWLTPANAENVDQSRSEGLRRWTGDLHLHGKRAFRYEQSLREGNQSIEVGLRVRALREAKLDGVFLDIKVPATDFAGGRLEGTGDGQAELPNPQSRKTVFSGQSANLQFVAPDGRGLFFETDKPCSLSIKAHPGWMIPHYRVLITVHGGDMHAGQVVETTYRFRTTGQSDHSPARLRLDTGTERYRLEGFGGNYCFWPRGEAVDYTLDHLKPDWARTQMFLLFWEPDNDDGDPGHINWDAFEDKEKGMWILQTEMNAARRMAERGIPFIISCWQVPDWMRVPESEKPEGKRPIARSKWPEVVESICAYLIYLKKNYGAEPAMFSFNEPQLGRIPDPEDHRDFNKMLGQRMQELGLKTRILAGDVNTPGGDKIEYPKPLLEDPEARRYVRGLSFHSWGGATAETYRAWSDLARKHDLPLFCAELGWNALAHKSRASSTALYALKELEVYQDLLLHARPQVLLEWEYGGSYPLLIETEDGLQPTTRYWMVSQFANRTPTPAVALGTHSDNPRVTFTAFRGVEDGRITYALHVANLGAGRAIALEGLPADLTALNASHVSIPDPKRPAPETVETSRGRLEMRLEPLSLTTLCWKE